MIPFIPRYSVRVWQRVCLSSFRRKTTDVCALAPNADYVAKPLQNVVGGGGWSGAERTGAARRDKLAMGEHLPACACGSGVGVCAHCNYIVTAGPAYNYYGSSDCSLPSPARSPGFRKSFSSYPGRQSSTAQSPLPLLTSCSYSCYIIMIMI